jgi:type IV secretory pathway TraG/TraD family ATPase VirD4
VPGEWESLFGQGGTGGGIPLGTARWLEPEAAIARFRFPASDFEGRVLIGEGFDGRRSPLGYEDDRYVCLVSGSRGGKGVGVIVPNLCIWPGSCIVVDPKGENATVTARRRGDGSEYAIGIGQKVRILDPYCEVQLPAELKARYNPLDAIDPEGDFAVDDAARIAAALIVVESRTDPYWELAGRNLIKGLILHVLSAPYLAKDRSLVMVRRLLTQGDWLTLEKVRNAGVEELPSAFEVLWSQMRKNPAFNGVVAGVGEQMIAMPEKQRGGVLEAARTNTEFIDSIPMQRLLETSDFDLGELKTNPQGLTIYLTLPQRFMETHYRWLRLMITLAVGEMERIKGRTATGYPTLFVLDEFAGLRRMEVIENAAAQAAGMGIKFLFVIQNLAQLNEVYEKSWETFFGNSGLKLFFQIDDDFSRSYLSRQLGELETVRQTHSGSQSQSASFSTSDGRSFSTNVGSSSSRSRGISEGSSWTYGGLTRFLWSKSRNDQIGWSHTRSRGDNWGRSRSRSFSTSHQTGDSTTSGWAEGVHKRPLLNPDEIGRLLARIDDRRRPGYPGLVLALVPGEHPLLARRVNYFESPRFRGYFDPHPNYPPPPTLAELAQQQDGGLAWRRSPAALSVFRARLLKVFRFLFRSGFLTIRGAFRLAASLVVFAIGLWALAMVGAVLSGFAVGLYERHAGTATQNHPPGEPQPQPVAPAPVPSAITAESRPEAPARSPGAQGAVKAPSMSADIQPKMAPDSTDNGRSSASPPRSGAYWHGTADWAALQAWFSVQHGDRQAGAEYWAANRHVRGHASCNGAAGRFDGDRSEFAGGCLGAKRILDPMDEKREDPDYRAGFNDEAQRVPLSSQTGSGDGNSSERYATVSTINLNLRTGPGPEYDSVAVMPEGTKVKIVKDADDGWKELEVHGADGQELHGFANGAFLAPAPAP